MNFIKENKFPADAILLLASMDVTSLYTNIPKEVPEEGIQKVCRAYQTFYVSNKSPPNTTTGTVANATHSSSLEKTIFKYLAQPWAQRG